MDVLATKESLGKVKDCFSQAYTLLMNAGAQPDLPKHLTDELDRAIWQSREMTNRFSRLSLQLEQQPPRPEKFILQRVSEDSKVYHIVSRVDGKGLCGDQDIEGPSAPMTILSQVKVCQQCMAIHSAPSKAKAEGGTPSRIVPGAPYTLKDGRGPFDSIQECLDAMGMDKQTRPQHNRWERLSKALKDAIIPSNAPGRDGVGKHET